MSTRGAFAAALVSVALGCARGEPPPPDLAGQSPSAYPITPPSTAPAPSGPAPSAATVQPHAAADAAAPAPADDPGALPQTRDRPARTSPALDARTRALWEAIVHDEPERAAPFFFPVKAYAQVKAIPRPESDWRHRLVGAYHRDIHALHRKLGPDAEHAQLVALEIPEGGGRWVEPDEETNKLGYFRVYGSRIRYEVGGKERSFEVKSLISWRGEWYVVHLSSFK